MLFYGTLFGIITTCLILFQIPLRSLPLYRRTFLFTEQKAVSLPKNQDGYIDIYIDDFLGVTPDVGDNVLKLSRVLPLAIHTVSRPVNDSNIIPRKDVISMKKFSAEGRLEEVKKVLGWDLNTKSLRLSLPHDKLRD